jgi:hypothetical protein
MEQLERVQHRYVSQRSEGEHSSQGHANAPCDIAAEIVAIVSPENSKLGYRARRHCTQKTEEMVDLEAQGALVSPNKEVEKDRTGSSEQLANRQDQDLNPTAGSMFHHYLWQ